MILLRQEVPADYKVLWPRLLEACHVTEPELRKLLWSMVETGKITIPNRLPENRAVKNHHRIALPQ